MMKLWTVKWAAYLARKEEKRNALKLLVENPESQRPLGRPKPKVDNSKIDLRKI
jgi:hypothetical protein